MRKNFEKKKYFFFIVLSISFQSLAAISGKYAALSIIDITIYDILSNFFYLLSLLCLFLQAIVWQQALIHYSLSFAYPFISLVNFVVLLASALLFHESITLPNIIGLGIISLGITILTRSMEEVT